MQKRVLVVTYYWPPAGGSGVQRWLKFCKYLRSYGWEPVIYTAQNPEAPAYDSVLLAEVPEGVEVIKRKVLEPYTLFRALTGQRGQNFGAGLASTGNSKRSILKELSLWVRGNLFIPDARMLWIAPSSAFLVKYLKANPVDLIVSTGPPHSTHLIAKRVSKRMRIPWVADFRDPWTNIDFFLDLKPTALSKAIHTRLERQVLTGANAVVTVTNGWGADLIALGAKHLTVIENGFDEADFSSDSVTLDPQFTLTHIGTLSPNRNCNNLWRALGRIVKSNQQLANNFRLKFVGSVDSSAIEAIEVNGLTSYCDFLGYVPHGEAIRIQQQSQVLLLLVNNSPNAMGIQTGKVFEYMAAQRPILAIGPLGGDTQTLIEETQTGVFIDFNSEEEIEKGINRIWNEYLEGFAGFKPQNISKYTRRGLTERMAKLFDKVVGVN